MGVLEAMIEDIPLPRTARIRQRFDGTHIEDLESVLAQKLQHPGGVERIKPGDRIAIAVGSRGIDQLVTLTRVTVEQIRRAGGEPFIVPSMGSHGGATAEGQAEVLAQLGVTEESVGAPIRSSMDVVTLGTLPNGLPVYADRIAAEEADGIVIINRVKPHTAFRAKVESGLLKMISIGLGKQKGAEATHQLGFGQMGENVPAMAEMIISKLPILFGVATVENAFDQVCRVEVIPAEEIADREPALLEEAKARMPRLLFDQIDVLVIDWIGKNISGDGMDPNITGRYPTPYAHGGPDVNKMVVCDLTPQSHGNANGIGTADFATQRLVDKMDKEATYANGLTSTVVAPTKIATTLPNDRYALKAAVKTCNILDYTKVRLVRIKDTLHLGEIEISESMLDEARAHPDIEIVIPPRPLAFDDDGNLIQDW